MPKAANHKSPDELPSAAELGAQKTWLKANGFSAAQAAKLNMSQTRRRNAAIIASWQKPIPGAGNGK